MAKKKKKEPVIIKNTPLEPTTIGIIERKEGGPLFTIILIIIFISCIIALPSITEFIQEGKVPTFTKKPTEKPSENPPTVEEPNEIEYLSFDDKLNIKVDNFTFQYFGIDEVNKTLEFRITNNSGKVNFFKENKYYLELYTTDKLLLKRLKVPGDDIIKLENYSYDISDIDSKSIALVALILKDTKDYPPVVLEQNASSKYVLNCSKGTENLTYEFEEDEDLFYLVQITEENSYLETSTEDYETVLKEKTNLNTIYSGVTGVESELIPIRSGFRFQTTIDLKNMNRNSLNQYFKGEKYYIKDTEAKTVAFELEASGYTCK